MPSSVKDRFTVDFEYVFFFVKSKKYWFEQIFEPIGSKSESYGMSARFVKLNPQGHNKRSVWKVNTKGFKGSHFATFPATLIEPMIKAGCPEFVCKKCGKARYLIIKSNPKEREIEWHNEKYGEGDETGKRLGRMQPQKSVYNTSQKFGYTDCGCGADFEPGVVLDPFMGSGTTALVARNLSRKFVGIELNPKYIEIAEKRLQDTFGMFR